MLDMIKCSTGGAYYARGEWIPADGNADAALAAKGFDAASIANAKTGTMLRITEYIRTVGRTVQSEYRKQSQLRKMQRKREKKSRLISRKDAMISIQIKQ